MRPTIVVATSGVRSRVDRQHLLHRYWRIGLAGVLAGIVFSLLSVLTFYVLGVLPGILYNPEIQSPKVIAVVETLPPPPVLERTPYLIFAGWALILIGYAFLYHRISVLWPDTFRSRLWRLTLTIWFFSLLFFEFQGPFNLLAEPLPLLALELLFWAVCALGAAAVIVAIAGTTKPIADRDNRL